MKLEERKDFDKNLNSRHIMGNKKGYLNLSLNLNV